MRSLGLVIVLGVVAAACSSFSGDDPAPAVPADDGGGGGDAGADGRPVIPGTPQDFQLSIAPLADTQTIIQGKPTTVPIVLTRGKQLKGPITITITGFTNGVTAAPLTMDGTTGNLVLSSPSGTQGNAQGMIEATIDTYKAATPLTTFVRGAPGALDTRWGNGGHLLAYTEAKNSGATVDLALGKNDDLYSLSGALRSDSGTDNHVHVVHLDKTGIPDPAYGAAGVASCTTYAPTAGALGADGRLVFVGSGFPPPHGSPGAASGMDYGGFSPDGKTTEFTNTTSTVPGGLDGKAAGAYAVTTRGTDGHVFIGFDNVNTTTAESDCGITHVDSKGALVNAFGLGGSLRNTVSAPVGMLIQTGGALAVLSVGTNVVDYVRYNADTGAPLNATAKTISIAGVRRSFRGAAGLVALADESIIAPFNGTAGLYLLKLDVNGDPVATFGNAGLGGPYGIAGAAMAMGIAIDANGKVLVALDTGGILRVTSTGDPDTDFGSGGLAPTEASQSLHRRVVVQKDGGRILVSGVGASPSEVVVSAYWP